MKRTTIAGLAATLLLLAACGSEDNAGAVADPGAAATAAREKRVDELESQLDELGNEASTLQSEESAGEEPAAGEAEHAPAEEEPATEEAPAAPAAAGAPVHWTYAEAAEWGELSPDFTACVDETQQSPIDLSGANPVQLEDITFAYGTATGSVVNNGHTIQANLENAGGIVIEGTQYALLQLHFHGPSEHTVNGVPYPLEVHFVHKSEAGKLAVVGIVFSEGAANAAYEPLLASLPTGVDEPVALHAALDPIAMMPSVHSVFRYAGSLTTPPCSEGVTWSVMAISSEMSAAQIDSLVELFPEENNRPIQPLGDRTLSIDLSQDS